MGYIPCWPWIEDEDSLRFGARLKTSEKNRKQQAQLSWSSATPGASNLLSGEQAVSQVFHYKGRQTTLQCPLDRY